MVFDADSGALLRPNGVATHGNLLFVAERDNHRVQVLELPGFEPLGSFGQTAFDLAEIASVLGLSADCLTAR